MVVPSSLRDDVLRHLHDNMGDFGVERTTDSVKTCFYWPGYEADIAQWVLQCEACQRRNPPGVTPCAPLGTLEASYPFERISWDIMGPLPTTEKGNRYISVVTDLFTKWVEAFAFPNTLATTLAGVLVDEVICRYGVPSFLHSDQGTNLCGKVVQSVCKLLGMERTCTSAYHPQGNGQVKHFNRTVEAILAKMTQEN